MNIDDRILGAEKFSDNTAQNWPPQLQLVF